MENLWRFSAPEGKSSYTERVIGVELPIVYVSWTTVTYGPEMALGKLLAPQRVRNSITLLGGLQ